MQPGYECDALVATAIMGFKESSLSTKDRRLWCGLHGGASFSFRPSQYRPDAFRVLDKWMESYYHGAKIVIETGGNIPEDAPLWFVDVDNMSGNSGYAHEYDLSFGICKAVCKARGVWPDGD